jgi:hypothetical protein
MPTLPVQTTLTKLHLAQGGRFAEIRELFAPQLQALVVPDALKAGWDAELGRHGPIASIGSALSEPTGAGYFDARVGIQRGSVACPDGG